MDKNEKDGFFLRNGAAVLEQQISLFNGDCNPIRSYSMEEIVKATSDFQWPIYKGLHYTLYKGIHEDREISVEKFTILEYTDTRLIERIATEVAIASRMSNHKNVLKLLGCCLETDFPILVYEFPGKGNLTSYTYGDIQQLLPWERKLRIAIEIANAIACLHHGLSKMIIHRDIKPSNIYLDQNYAAKLFRFELAVPIPEGETHVTVDSVLAVPIPEGETLFSVDSVRTVRFIAREEVHVQLRCTEKSDVYNFGVLLCEFLTGKKFRDLQDSQSSNESHTRTREYSRLSSVLEDSCEHYPEEENIRAQLRECAELVERCIKDHSSVLEDCCELYPEEENIRAQVGECVELVKRCIKDDPDDRPDMIEAEKARRRIKSMQY